MSKHVFVYFLLLFDDLTMVCIHYEFQACFTIEMYIDRNLLHKLQKNTSFVSFTIVNGAATFSTNNI